MLVIPRREAKAQNLKRYYTGKKCCHGHISERFTSNGRCIECMKIVAASPEYKETVRLWINKNRDKRKAISRRSKLRIKSCPKRYLKNAYTNMRYRCYGLKRTHPSYIVYVGVQCKITLEEFIEWSMKESDFPEIHKKWKDARFESTLAPSLDRIDSDIHYSIDNIQWLTRSAHAYKTNDDIKKLRGQV